jgi:transforming growth factor-beta-induced protein
MRKVIASTLLVAALAIPALAATGTGAAASTKQAANDKTIVETAAADRRFTTLVSLVKRAGLASALAGETKLTVFAPTNAAFAKVPTATLRKLRRDRALLRRVLLYHAIAGDVKAAQVVKLRTAKTLAGPSVRIRVRDGNVYLNNRRTKVVQTDIAATNGTIHVINRVLLPPAR